MVAAALTAMLVLAGCVGRDREPELVTAETMEKLGYERPDLCRSSRLRSGLRRRGQRPRDGALTRCGSGTSRRETAPDLPVRP